MHNAWVQEYSPQLIALISHQMHDWTSASRDVIKELQDEVGPDATVIETVHSIVTLFNV
jgi:hypothetical protein